MGNYYVGIHFHCSLGQNISNFSQFPFTTSETELNQYHQKLNVQNASRDEKRLIRLRILGNKDILRKSLKCLRLMMSSTQSANYQKSKFR